MGPLAILGAVGAATGLAGSAASYFGQKSTNKTNIKLAEQGRQHDVDMWNKQNAYNTPEMQMQRYKEAGLNPNLIYGSGQASAGNASPAQKAPIAETSNAMATFGQNQLIPVLSQYNDWQVKKAQIRNIEEETNNKTMTNEILSHSLPWASINAQNESKLKRYSADSKHTQTLLQDLNYQDLYKTQDSRRSILDGKLGEQKQRLEFINQSSEQKRIENELNQKLKGMGMSQSDELWQRLIGLLAGKFIPGANKLFK